MENGTKKIKRTGPGRPADPEKKVRLTIWLPPDTARQLRDYRDDVNHALRKEGMSETTLSTIVEDALDAHLFMG